MLIVAGRLQVPQTHKDKFFDRFYHIISLSVFVAYKVSLVDSDSEFDGAFLGEISRLFAYWTTGGDIGPNSYVLPNGTVLLAPRHIDARLCSRL